MKLRKTRESEQRSRYPFRRIHRRQT